LSWVPFAPPGYTQQKPAQLSVGTPESNLQELYAMFFNYVYTSRPVRMEMKGRHRQNDYRKHLRIASGLTELEYSEVLESAADLSRPTRRYSRNRDLLTAEQESPVSPSLLADPTRGRIDALTSSAWPHSGTRSTICTAYWEKIGLTA